VTNITLLARLAGLEHPAALPKALFAALGGYDPLGTIWELIPWSFLVDYFVDFGGFLERHTLRPFEGEWGFDEYTFSRIDTREYTVTLDYAPYQGDSPHATRAVARVKTRHYQRTTQLPSELVFSFPPTAGQAALIAALAVALL